MLTIGEFSRICFVTKKTLRHYDEIGLLRPEHTADNGYRYYTPEQLRTMLLISRLKNYGLSLPEIAAVLANPDKELLAWRLEEKRRQMEGQIRDTRRILRQMEQDIGKLKRRMDIMDRNIVVKTVELAPQSVYGVRRKINVKDFPEIMSCLFRDVQEKGMRPEGPPMTFYHDEAVDAGFDQENADVEVAVPVSGSAATRRTTGGLHCFATLLGPYVSEGFTATYAGLCQWTEENGYRITGAPFEKYVRGGEGVEPADYVTEIYFPIAK